MSRRRVVESFCAYVSAIQAHALEHACQTYAQGSGASYERAALRCLHFFQTGHLDAAKLLALGPQALASMPTELLVERIPAKDALRSKEERRAQSLSLLRALQQGELTEDVLPNTGLRCKKCGSNDITHDFLQTRSADEGTTIFCTCTNCKKRWKM
jgi:DNA-directed RNA polymerase subunit M/transcription elongation factor TFIIS